MDDGYRDDDLHPQAPDTFSLRRRVLLTGVVSLTLYLASVVLLDALDAPGLVIFVFAALIYLFVIRPMMRPVREAVALRRQLAFQAWQDERDTAADDEPPRG